MFITGNRYLYSSQCACTIVCSYLPDCKGSFPGDEQCHPLENVINAEVVIQQPEKNRRVYINGLLYYVFRMNEVEYTTIVVTEQQKPEHVPPGH